MSKRQVSLHNGAEGSAALQLCHSGTLWQNALLQLAGAPEGGHGLGALALGAHTPRGHSLPTHAGMGWRGLSSRWSPPPRHPGARGGYHPSPWGQPGCSSSLDIRWDGAGTLGRLAGHCMFARLGLSGSTRVSGRRGLCGDVERGVCVCWFSPPGADPE